jgi:ABC-type lipoprotein release transport system permease subunit
MLDRLRISTVRFLTCVLLTIGPPVAVAVAAAEAVPDVLLSRQLVETHGIEIGDVIALSASRAGEDARRFRVAGIYEPVPDPFRLTSKRHEARLHLGDLIGMVADPDDPAATESVDRVNIVLQDESDAAEFSRELSVRVLGILVQPTAETLGAEVFVVLERFHVAVAVVTVVGSTAFLLALMVMRVDQRRETAGILRLIGVSRPRILLEVFIEGAFIALVGAVFGVALAAALQGVFNAFFQWHYDTALVFVQVTPGIALRCVALAIPLGILAGLVASWTLLRRDILTLLRR